MALLLIFGAIAIVANLRLATRVWRVNAFYGIVSFFFFPAAIPFMYAYWGDEDHDIKLVFVLTFVATIVCFYQKDKLEAEAQMYDDNGEVEVETR